MPPKRAASAPPPCIEKVTLGTPKIRARTVSIPAASPSPSPASSVTVASDELPLIACGVFDLSPDHQFVTAVYGEIPIIKRDKRERSTVGRIYQNAAGTQIFVSLVIYAHKDDTNFNLMQSILKDPRSSSCQRYYFFTDTLAIATEAVEYTQFTDLIIVDRSIKSIQIEHCNDRSQYIPFIEAMTKLGYTVSYIQSYSDTQPHFKHSPLTLKSSDQIATSFKYCLYRILEAEFSQEFITQFFDFCRTQLSSLLTLINFVREDAPTPETLAAFTTLMTTFDKELPPIDRLFKLESDPNRAYHLLISILIASGFTLQVSEPAARATTQSAIDHMSETILVSPITKETIAFLRPGQHIADEQAFKRNHRVYHVFPFTVINNSLFETIANIASKVGPVIKNPALCLAHLFQHTEIEISNLYNAEISYALTHQDPRTTENTPCDLLTVVSTMYPGKSEKFKLTQRIATVATPLPWEKFMPSVVNQSRLIAIKSCIEIPTQAQRFDNKLELSASTLRLITIAAFKLNDFQHQYLSQRTIKFEKIFVRDVDERIYMLHDYASFDELTTNLTTPQFVNYTHVIFINSDGTTHPYFIIYQGKQLTFYCFDVDEEKLLAISKSVDKSTVVKISTSYQDERKETIRHSEAELLPLITEEMLVAINKTSSTQSTQSLTVPESVNGLLLSLSLYNYGVSLTGDPTLRQKSLELIQTVDPYNVSGNLKQAYEYYQLLIASCIQAGMLISDIVKDTAGNQLGFICRYPRICDEATMLLHPIDQSSKKGIAEKILATTVNEALSSKLSITAANTKVIWPMVDKKGMLQLTCTEPGDQRWFFAKPAADQPLEEVALGYIGIERNVHGHFVIKERPNLPTKEKSSLSLSLNLTAGTHRQWRLFTPIVAVVKAPGKNGLFGHWPFKEKPAVAATAVAAPTTRTLSTAGGSL